MKKILLILTTALLLGCSAALAAETVVPLPQVVKTGGPGLVDALVARQSTRSFSDKPFDKAQLASLLWATGGINRPGGFLTYPTALDVRDMTIYAITAEAAYRYDPEANALIEVAQGDYRADAGKQPYVATAALNLIYVQDMLPLDAKNLRPQQIKEMGCIHAGAMAQNASLFAASQGWGAVVRASFDADKLAIILKLAPSQNVILAQSFGFKALLPSK